MLGRLITNMIGLIIASLLAATASAADYRGTAAGWPTYANGTYAANYPANYANGAYYVARPVAAAGYAQSPGAMYVPANAAYANPSYFAAYGRSPVAYRPVSTAGYAPVAGGYYAPNTAYYAPAATAYAPTTANYAPANSYAVTPAGIGGGSEAAAYYGQPTSLNYVPPRVAYRPTYASVPVYMYRPVTAYQPVAGYQAAVQPVTCMQASTCNTCQPAPRRCFSFLNPFTWFGHGSGSSCCGYRGCGSSGCGAAPTTAYCGQAACGQQPYYPQPMVPVVPVYPGPTTAVPANTIPALPRGFMQPAQPTIPPPPTVQPGTRTIIGPAETRPSLAPQPGTTFPPAPGNFGVPPTGGIPVPPAGSFQTQPQPPPPTGFGPGSFGTGTNYAPATDPYSATMTPVSPPAGSTNSGANNSEQNGPNHSVFGSGYRGSSPARAETRSDDNVIRAPGSAPALQPSVKTVPDLDAPQSPRPVNAAPQLIDPRDKTAFRDPKWAVVPAQWPTKQSVARQLSERPVAETKVHQAHGGSGLSQSPYAKAQPSAVEYDDGGWKTAAF